MPDPKVARSENRTPTDDLHHPLLRGLNPVQREAVRHGDGPIILFAGAGTGKTRVLTHRVAYLLAERGVRPSQILAVTFTNKAAQEMIERIGRIVGQDVSRFSWWVGTFHAICARLLREFGDRLGLPKNFVIYDTEDQMTLLKRDCLPAFNLDEKRFTPRSILTRISAAKEKLIPPEAWHDHFTGYVEDVVGKIYPVYQEKLRQNNALDFDDLLTHTVRLLRTQPEVLERLQNRFRYILVDEYQDVNEVQYTFLTLIADKHRNILVVGDDDQSVYQFRGADVRFILKFEADYPEARVLKLEQNYRSTPTILKAAYGVVSNNRTRKDKELWTENPEHVPLRLHEALNEQEEAVWIAQKILDDIKTGGRKWSDFALLYRTNAQSRALEDVLVNWRVPYKVVGGLRFYDRKEIKDALAYLRLIQNPTDSISLRRVLNVPPRGIGATTVAALETEVMLSGLTFWEVMQQAERLAPLQPRARARLTDFVRLIEGLQAERDKVSVSELLEKTLERSGYRAWLEEENSIEAQTRLENVRELFTVTKQFELENPTPTLDVFLEQVALVSDLDSLDTGANAVTLMTLHAAKGLEFPVVFLTGMEEGVFPHFRSRESDREIEEERRLCYVGITRAREELCLTHASRRTLFGNIAYNPPSRFLSEIPRELFQETALRSDRGPALSSFDPDAPERPAFGAARNAPRPPKLWQEGPPSPQQRERREQHESGFRVGQKVKHPTFGIGVILNITGEEPDTVVEAVFPNVGPKRLLLAYAKLERVK
jgi:DNA helicase-2/ATP-dependent DNA helicase PcrA